MEIDSGRPTMEFESSEPPLLQPVEPPLLEPAEPTILEPTILEPTISEFLRSARIPQRTRIRLPELDATSALDSGFFREEISSVMEERLVSSDAAQYRQNTNDNMYQLLEQEISPQHISLTNEAGITKHLLSRASLAISLMWNHDQEDRRNDLDLWVTTPSGERIGVTNKFSADGGELDVDRKEYAPEPIENIVWLNKAPTGTFKIQVHNYYANHDKCVPFYVSIVIDGNEDGKEILKCTMPGRVNTWVDVKSFEYGSCIAKGAAPGHEAEEHTPEPSPTMSVGTGNSSFSLNPTERFDITTFYIPEGTRRLYL